MEDRRVCGKDARTKLDDKVVLTIFNTACIGDFVMLDFLKV